MTTVEQNGEHSLSIHQPEPKTARLHWKQILAISIFWFALNFHWSALSIIILPSQVFKLVGQAHEGEVLAFVLIPGAFVSLITNPLFGLLSDQTRGKLAAWGRRRPYILFGTLMNVGGLIWMAASRDIISLALAYSLVQFANNAAQAPFHAFLPDIAPAEQRGQISGVMGLLQVSGGIVGVIMAGLFVDAHRPDTAYWQGLWLIYGLIMAVIVAFMLITFFSIHEHNSSVISETTHPTRKKRPAWLKTSLLYTIAGTILAIGLLWGIMALWNMYNIANVRISNDVQQVILEVVATIGILRLFDFHPRRNPDFAWVLLTRLLMMLGIYTIQSFLQFYMRDVVGASHPEQQTTNFAIVVSIASLASAFAVGWLSDHFGRKRMVYFSGGMIAVVGLIFIVTHSLPIVLAAGALFGLGYGAYQSVDWALVTDVLPSQQHYARDMGVWNISLSLPQVIAPVLGGPLIDTFTRNHQTALGFQLLFAMALIYCLLGTVTVHYIRSAK